MKFRADCACGNHVSPSASTYEAAVVRLRQLGWEVFIDGSEVCPLHNDGSHIPSYRVHLPTVDEPMTAEEEREAKAAWLELRLRSNKWARNAAQRRLSFLDHQEKKLWSALLKVKPETPRALAKIGSEETP